MSNDNGGTTNQFNIDNKVSGGAQQQNIGQSGGEATMNVTQGDSVTVEAAVEDVFNSLIEVAPQPTREIPGTEPTATEGDVPVATTATDDGPEAVTFTDDEIHPAAVFSQVKAYSAEGAEAPSEEEQKTFGSKLSACFKKYGTMAAKSFVPAAKVAISVIGATASPAFPLNLVSAGLSAVVEQVKD